MARLTVYNLYKTGRIDPTLSHIWAFESIQERETWLASKYGMQFVRQKYWRVGSTIKIPVSYEKSFEYDYVRITNDSGTADARDWYAFITARAYISQNVTLLTLEVDYIQTYYFNGQTPFWDCPGFVVRTTAHLTPLVGTHADLPVPQSVTEVFWNESGAYACIVMSTFDPSTISGGSPTYTGVGFNGVFSSVAPYVVGASTQQTLVQSMTTLVNDINNAGLTDGVAAIYVVPSRYIPSNLLDGSPHLLTSFVDIMLTATPTLHSTYEYSYLLDNLDYSYYVVNNGQGETQTFYRYEFTNGTPVFTLRLSVSGGMPTLYLIPSNMIYNSADAAQQRSMKITQAISCVFLNDSYKIWLAQTQDSRAAALGGAELAINQAVEARQKSWAYQFGDVIEGGMDALREPVTSAVQSVQNALPSSGTNDVYMDPETGLSASKPLPGYELISRGTKSTGAAPSRLSDDQINQMYNLASRYIAHQIGIETRYTFDHAVANANLALYQLEASWSDKARVPATARGASAYGDMALLRQYGFMIGYYSPAPAIYAELNRMISAAGHTVNVPDNIYREHEVFDYWMVNSAKIPVNTAVRPEFVRKLMLDVLQRGVYFWYISSGDISSNFGSPYDLNNPVYSGS